MKNISFIIALLLSFAILTPATMTGQSSPEKSSAAAVESHVRKLWEAFKNKDKTTLSSLLDDKFRMFEEGLSTFGDKKAEVNGPDEYDLVNYTLSDFTVTPIGPNSALVTYVADYQGKSGGEIQKAKSVLEKSGRARAITGKSSICRKRTLSEAERVSHHCVRKPDWVQDLRVARWLS